MIGTVVNASAVFVGAAAGAAFGSRLPERCQETLFHCIGMVTLLIGMKMAVRTENEVIVLGALLVGGLAGESWRLEDRLERAGKRLETRFGKSQGGLGTAIITPTLLFCVGPLTFMGCLRDGMTGDTSLLITKSVLDLFSSLVFAAAMGWRVIISAALVLLIQGSLTIGSSLVSQAVTEDMSRELFATGGVVLLGLALKLMDLKQIRVANLLPALFVAPLLVRIVSLFATGK